MRRFSMGNVQSSSHSKWECIYHITWIPKYRKKKIYKELRKYLAEVFRELARQKECKVMEGHLMPDHVHVMMSIPPKYAVAQIIGFIKGKSAIQIARNFVGRRKILQASISGHVVITYRQLAEMKRRYASILKSRKKKIAESIS
jgi:putative transposase